LEESQRSYSPEIFEDRVWFFGIKDQTPPLFELLLKNLGTDKKTGLIRTRITSIPFPVKRES